MWFPDIPDGGWKKVIIVTSGVTLLVSALAVSGTMMTHMLAGLGSVSPVDILTAIILSIVLTAPIFSFLMIKNLELRQANTQLHFFATYDFLTAALSRRAFVEAVETQLLNRRANPSQLDSALLVIDVDHFKLINDRYGHQTGDLALVRIADTLRSVLREGDLFGRLGGEEFGIFLDNITPASAIELAERCREAINQCPFTPDGEEHSLTISVGVALATADTDFSALFLQADRRLFAAKELGRNRIESPSVPVAA